MFKYLRKVLVPIQRPLNDHDVAKIRIKSMIRRAEKQRIDSLYLTNPQLAIAQGYKKNKAIKA